MLIQPGDSAPSFNLPDAGTGQLVTSPWREGDVVLSFYKVTCPVCQMTAPKVQALADGGLRVVGIGQDPPEKLVAYGDKFGQSVRSLSESPPYRVSDVYGISVVPTLVLVGGDGVVKDSVAAWDRDRWNHLAMSLGAPAVSREGDGLPVFRPG